MVTLGQKVKQAPKTTPDNDKTAKDESKFTDRSGNPTSKIKLNAGDVIGTTMQWNLSPATAKYYPNYSNLKPGTFHFAFLKYEYVQQYRSKATGGGGVAPDEVRDKMTPQEREKTPALGWYVAPCSPESPVRCFK